MCIEKWTDGRGRPALGGTCLNVGCIPSKALLDSSHHFHNLSHLLPGHGISVDGARIDVAAMQARKSRVVASLGRGVAGLLRKNGVELVAGTARLTSDGAVEVAGASPRVLRPRHIVIAAGSVPATLAAAPVDGECIVDSEGALAFVDTPRRLGIIGAGVIGLELGSVWNRLGSEVVLLEALEDFLPAADRDIAKDSLRILRRQGLDIRLGKRVTGCDTEGDAVSVHFEDADGVHRLEVTAWWSRSDGGPPAATSGWRRLASNATSGGLSGSTNSAARPGRTSGRLATAHPDPCSLTGHRRTGSPSRNASRGSRAGLITAPCPG